MNPISVTAGNAIIIIVMMIKRSVSKKRSSLSIQTGSGTIMTGIGTNLLLRIILMPLQSRSRF